MTTLIWLLGVPILLSGEATGKAFLLLPQTAMPSFHFQAFMLLAFILQVMKDEIL